MKDNRATEVFVVIWILFSALVFFTRFSYTFYNAYQDAIAALFMS